MGKSRSYQPSDEAQAERRRAHYIQSRRSLAGVTVQASQATDDRGGCRGNADTDRTPGSDWGAGFQPRERVETVRNCAALPRDFVDGVVLQVTDALLGMTAEESGGSPGVWNQGGRRKATQSLIQ